MATSSTDSLRSRIRSFLHEFGFARLEWDGHEVTLVSLVGEPWSIREFERNSQTHQRFAKLIADMRKREMRPFRIGRK